MDCGDLGRSVVVQLSEWVGRGARLAVTYPCFAMTVSHIGWGVPAIWGRGDRSDPTARQTSATFGAPDSAAPQTAARRHSGIVVLLRPWQLRDRIPLRTSATAALRVVASQSSDNAPLPPKRPRNATETMTIGFPRLTATPSRSFVDSEVPNRRKHALHAASTTAVRCFRWRRSSSPPYSQTRRI